MREKHGRGYLAIGERERSKVQRNIIAICVECGDLKGNRDRLSR